MLSALSNDELLFLFSRINFFNNKIEPLLAEIKRRMLDEKCRINCFPFRYDRGASAEEKDISSNMEMFVIGKFTASEANILEEKYGKGFIKFIKNSLEGCSYNIDYAINFNSQTEQQKNFYKSFVEMDKIEISNKEIRSLVSRCQKKVEENVVNKRKNEEVENNRNLNDNKPLPDDFAGLDDNSWNTIFKKFNTYSENDKRKVLSHCCEANQTAIVEALPLESVSYVLSSGIKPWSIYREFFKNAMSCKNLKASEVENMISIVKDWYYGNTVLGDSGWNTIEYNLRCWHWKSGMDFRSEHFKNLLKMMDELIVDEIYLSSAMSKTLNYSGVAISEFPELDDALLGNAQINSTGLHPYAYKIPFLYMMEYIFDTYQIYEISRDGILSKRSKPAPIKLITQTQCEALKSLITKIAKLKTQSPSFSKKLDVNGDNTLSNIFLIRHRLGLMENTDYRMIYSKNEHSYFTKKDLVEETIEGALGVLNFGVKEEFEGFFTVLQQRYDMHIFTEFEKTIIKRKLLDEVEGFDEIFDYLNQSTEDVIEYCRYKAAMKQK